MKHKVSHATPDKRIENVMQLSVWKSVKHRAPWLFIGLLGGILASRIVAGFENILSKNLILAAFIPLIVYMSDAVGTQMESFAIRDFALHSRLNYFKYFLKHLLVTATIALIVSIALFLFALIFNEGLSLAVILSVSLFFSIISSVLTGLLLPRFFRGINLDPANVSGPIATIIQDILSVLIYFSIASMML